MLEWWGGVGWGGVGGHLSALGWRCGVLVGAGPGRADLPPTKGAKKEGDE